MANEDFILKPVIGKQIKLFAEVLGAWNGNFELGPNAALPTNWFHDFTVGPASPFVASNTDPTHSGAFCAKSNMAYTGTIAERWAKPIGFSDQMGLGLDHSNLAKGFPVIPGYKYIIEAWGKKTLAAQEVKMDFKWMNGAGIISHVPTQQTQVVAAGAYEKIYCADFAPKNATMMNGLVKFKGTTTDGYCFVDDCKLWVPLGICSEIKFKADPGLTEILEWGAADPVANKEKANSYGGSFKNFYFSLYAWYLAERMANGALPEFELRIVMEQGTERRALKLPRTKLGAKEFSAAFSEMAGESFDFKFIGPIQRESGGAY